jgi:hypothetical protein
VLSQVAYPDGFICQQLSTHRGSQIWDHTAFLASPPVKGILLNVKAVNVKVKEARSRAGERGEGVSLVDAGPQSPQSNRGGLGKKTGRSAVPSSATGGSH